MVKGKETPQVADATKEVKKEVFSINCKQFADKILAKKEVINLDHYLQ